MWCDLLYRNLSSVDLIANAFAIRTEMSLLQLSFTSHCFPDIVLLSFTLLPKISYLALLVKVKKKPQVYVVEVCKM